VYTRVADGSLTHIDTSPAPQREGGVVEEDGPRHVKVHPNGRTTVLTYVASRSLIPPHLRTEGHADGAQPTYRGDTLLLAPSTAEQPAPKSIFATTRGGEGETTCGWVGVWRLDVEGMFAGDVQNNPYLVERYEAATPGGKAHALDVLPKDGDAGKDGEMWVLLTDDSPPHPGVRVLEWDGWLWRGGGTRLRKVAAWPPPGFYDSSAESAQEQEGEPERMAGGSHAVWLD
ncbi:hypothetical protein B0H10DRAFT_2099496, partial [Mycena sp. CBHHK59/15]